MHSIGVSKTPFRFLFYSHDGLGLGHIRRNLALAAAVVERSPESSILIATGSDEVSRLGLLPNIEALKLPGLQKVRNGHYVSRRLEIPQSDIFAMRSALMKAAVDSFRPDVMLVDKHPLGAHGELRPALDWHRSRGGQTALGLRDILDEPSRVRGEWQRHHLSRLIPEYHDEVLIYGDPKVFNAVSEYGFNLTLAQQTKFCGYVANPSEHRQHLSEVPTELACHQRKGPVVLATPGGGEDGAVLLNAFLESAVRAEWQSIVITGPMAPGPDSVLLRSKAKAQDIPVYTFVSGLSSWFSHVDAVVCMGGYNTLVETLSRGTPVVCIPRHRPRAEQLIRARAFARLGLLQVLEPGEVSPDRLRRAISVALNSSRDQILARVHSTLDFNGASRAAARLLRLGAKRRGMPARQGPESQAAPVLDPMEA